MSCTYPGEQRTDVVEEGYQSPPYMCLAQHLQIIEYLNTSVHSTIYTQGFLRTVTLIFPAFLTAGGYFK